MELNMADLYYIPGSRSNYQICAQRIYLENNIYINAEQQYLFVFRIYGTQQFGKITKTADQAEYDNG